MTKPIYRDLTDDEKKRLGLAGHPAKLVWAPNGRVLTNHGDEVMSAKDASKALGGDENGE